MLKKMGISVTSLLLVLGIFYSASLATAWRTATMTRVRGVGFAHLRCDAAPTPQKVEWFSNTWSTSRDPLVIAHSAGGFSFIIDPSHPNAANYYANRHGGVYELSIYNLNVEMDAGTYICRVTSPTGDQREHVFELTAIEFPSCEASEEEGGRTTLECEARVSGPSWPTVRWFTSDGRELETVDESTVGRARYVATTALTPATDDPGVFFCLVYVDEIQAVSCELDI